MRHELIIEKTHGANDWTRLDLGDEVPVMVFQINDLNDLKDRQTSYSQALKLPTSPTNCRAFGFANEFEARSVAPYRIHRCAWYEDGIQIIGTNFRLEILGVEDDYFECQIVSNLSGLFETLQSRTMEELDIPPVLWDYSTIIAMCEADDPAALYAWAVPLASQHTAGKYGLLQWSTTEADRIMYNNSMGLAANWMLYVRLIPLVREILSQAGYTLDTDVQSVPGYVEDLISLSDFKPGPDSMAPLQGSANGTPVTITAGQGAVYLLNTPVDDTFTYRELFPLIMRDVEVHSVTTNGFQYVAPGYMKVRVHLSAISNSDDDINSEVWYRIQRFGVSVTGEPPITGRDFTLEQEVIDEKTMYCGRPSDPNPYVSDIIELSPGERIYIEIILQEGAVAGNTYTGRFALEIPIEENSVPCGGYIYPQRSTDFKNQLEVIRLFVQLYGLFVDVDNDAKIVKAYNLNQIVDRITAGDFADWSAKLDVERTRETSFRLGAYEQKNRIPFNNNDFLNVQKSGVISVQNDNLRATKDLFTIAVETTENGKIQFASELIGAEKHPADIDIRYTQDERKGWFYRAVWPGSGSPQSDTLSPEVVPIMTYRASKMRLIQRQRVIHWDWFPFNVRVAMVPTENPREGRPANPYFGYLDPPQVYTAVGTEPQYYVDTYYSVMERNVLNPARVIEAAFNLTPSDIETLDLLRPVYIEAYGQFFYIQKINNYAARSLTKVSLVCLNYSKE